MVENLRVASDGLNVTGSAMIENGSGDFDLDLDIDDLTPIGTLAGRPLSGAVDLSASGTASADLSRFDVTLAGTDLREGLFHGTDMRGASFAGSNLEAAMFSTATWTCSRFMALALLPLPESRDYSPFRD